MDTWAPVFAISLGIPREQMAAMSVPEMVEHLDYWHETRRPEDGG